MTEYQATQLIQAVNDLTEYMHTAVALVILAGVLLTGAILAKD